MQTTFRRFLLAAVAGAIAGAIAFATNAADDRGVDSKVSDAQGTHACVRLQEIDDTPVIDDQTILIKMRGGGYKRMDLVARCSGLKMREGFAHKTWTNDICTTDPLRVLEPGGPTCMIKQIVDISPDEAKQLLARR